MPKLFNEKIEVRFADLDAYGHVNNAVFFTYLETARTKAFIKPFSELMSKGILLIVVNAECNYMKPITLSDNVYVEFTLKEKGKTSFIIKYEINDGNGITYATATTTMVCIDKHSNKPLKVPAELEKYMNA